MSTTQERPSTKDIIYQWTQKLASSGHKFATSSVKALGEGINDIKANPRVQEGASTVKFSVQKFGDRLYEIKTNPKVQEGATSVKTSVRKLGYRLHELKDSERVKKANNGVKQLGTRLQKFNLAKLISDMEKDQELADKLDRINRDIKDEKESLAMIREAEEACLKAITDHFIEFVATSPNTTYEEWIAELHPENTHEGLLLDGMGKELDHRFYVEDSDHRLLWNAHLGCGRTHVLSRTMGWNDTDNDNVGDVDLLSTANDNDDYIYEETDLEEELESLALMREAEEVCSRAMTDHFIDFVSESPNVTYEEWITDLHPENTHEGRLLTGMDKELDHRFYVEDSDHRVLWNTHLGSGRTHVPARKKMLTDADKKVDQIDFLSSANDNIKIERKANHIKKENGDDLITFDIDNSSMNF